MTAVSSQVRNLFSRCTVLLIEDEQEIARHLQDQLRAMGFDRIEWRQTGEDALLAVREMRFDVLLIDRLLEGAKLDGLAFLNAFRELNDASSTPSDAISIFMTVLGSNEHKLEGLHAGADDYLSKPVNDEELRARLFNFLVRRARQTNPNWRQTKANEMLTNGSLTVSAHGLVNWRESEIKLTQIETSILRSLMEIPGEPKTKFMIHREVWPDEVRPNGELDDYEIKKLDVHLVNLRRKLKEAGVVSGLLAANSSVIQNERRRGLLIVDLSHET